MNQEEVILNEAALNSFRDTIQGLPDMPGPAPIPVPLTETRPQEADARAVTEAYIRMLCKQTGQVYENLPLDRFEGLTERSKINEVFFGIKTEDIKVKINPSQVAALKNLSLNSTNKATLEARVRDNLSYYNSRLDEFELARINYALALRRLAEWKDLPPRSVYDKVKEQLESGKWEIVQVSGVDNFVVFAQAHNTVINWKDKQKAVDVQVNMGRYQVKIFLGNGTVQIFKYKDSLVVNGYPHPHVKPNGNVCWGNAKDHVSQAYVDGDIGKILDVCDLLLHEYNAESPYVRLDRFVEERDRLHLYEYIGPMFIALDRFAYDLINKRANRYAYGREYIIYKFYASKKDGKIFVSPNSDRLNLTEAPSIKEEYLYGDYDDCLRDYLDRNGIAEDEGELTEESEY